jgi:Bacterial Ig domain
LNGDHQVKATQGSNSASKTFKVAPVIIFNPISGPVGTAVNITGIGFSPSSIVTITFGGSTVDTTPFPVTTNNSGGFFATFNVPGDSSSGPQSVVASTPGSNLASKTFTVTVTPLSSLVATSRSNVSSFGAPTNQSNATLAPPPSNQSNATIPIVTNSSFDTAESNGTISLENNTPSLNASATQATENSSTAPTVKQMNDTSVIASIDNTINNNPPTSTSTQNNDTSNSKKSSEKNIPINPPTSNDQIQRTPTALTKDNTTNEIAQNESTNTLSDAKVKNKDTSSKGSETASSDSVTEKPSSITDDKTITKVTRSDSDNQPDNGFGNAYTSPRDMALFYKYLNSDKDNGKRENSDKALSQDNAVVNNRPVAINDKAITDANTPVNINILGNDKDSDGDKLSIMGMSPPLKGKIESSSDGIITYTPLESWSGTERFGYTISDGRGGVATASVTVIVQPTSVENQPPESQDQDVSVNRNNPVKIKLGAKDPDDGKLRFVLVSKPSHGRIVQLSSSTGTYVPDENYNGKDDFAFKVHDGTVFSKDAKVSIKIEKNEKLSTDQLPQNDQQPIYRPQEKAYRLVLS